MSRNGLGVTSKIEINHVNELPSSEELPERLQEAAVLYHKLGHEWFESLSRKAPVLRSDGYQLPTLMLFFFALFTGEFRASIRHVSNTLARQKNRLLAACCGFIGFPSQASVSRFLQSVCQDRLEEEMSWMLAFSHETARRLMRHAGGACRDTFGASWQIFDLDPTSTVVRQRGLPEGKELPPPKRRLDEIAGPGYPGRKRGEALFRRAVLQHTGSSLWLGSWLRYAGGDSRETFAAAINTVGKTCEFAGFDKKSAILRIDGEGGSIPTISACNKAGISFVFRSRHSSILEHPDNQQQLLKGQWYEVKDSGSGPQRFALDLGEVELTPSASLVNEEGEPYQPLTCRVIVTRFAASTKCSSGAFMDNAMYESFVTNLPSAAWPASEVATLYFHRATQENRFGREDKELSLDTIFSQTPQGQSMVTLIGLLVWNLRVLCGFEQAEADGDTDEKELLTSSERQIAAASPPTHKKNETQEEERSTTSNSDIKAQEKSDDDELKQLELQILKTIKKACPTLNKKGFYWEEGLGLRCPAGNLLNLSTIRKAHGNYYLTMLAPPGFCAECKLRHLCSKSTAANFRKERVIKLPPDAVEELTRLRILYKQLQTERALAEEKLQKSKTPQKSPLSAQNIDPHFESYIPDAAGPYQLVLPRLNPAELKRRFFTNVHNMSFIVRPENEPLRHSSSPYFYRSAADRSRQRRSWAERLSYNQRISPVHVRIFCTESTTTLLSTAKIKAKS